MSKTNQNRQHQDSMLFADGVATGVAISTPILATASGATSSGTKSGGSTTGIVTSSSASVIKQATLLRFEKATTFTSTDIGATPVAGQKLAMSVGDVVKSVGYYKQKGYGTYYLIPFKCTDGKIHTAEIQQSYVTVVSTTCSFGADGDTSDSSSTNLVTDTGTTDDQQQAVCINPNTPVIDNDPNDEYVPPASNTVFGMTPVLGYSVIVLAAGLLVFGFFKLFKKKK